MAPEICVLGLGTSPHHLPEAYLDRIREADILVGGKRQLAAFDASGAVKRVIDGDIPGLLGFIREHMDRHRIVVLASGDPLFHGIGTSLVRELGQERVRILANVSALQEAFSRIGLPWHDAKLVSLHASAEPDALLPALRRHDKVGILTRAGSSPDRIARRMCDSGLAGFRICVLERLGFPDERIGWYSPHEAATGRFKDPNVVICLRPEAPEAAAPALFIGMPDAWFAHEKGLITKPEVRAVSLSKLRLSAGQVLWDLGAGSGSVSVEASIFVTEGRIFSVEKNPERIRQIEENRRRFQVVNLTSVAARLPEGLDALPDPDRVFIGGGGRDLPAIIRAAAARLKPGGRMVINAVIMERLGMALSELQALHFEAEVVQVQVNESRPMPGGGHRLKAANPVWVISAGETPQ
jgi:precorrin-6Y C5,15-methyltransferase (decarboxylating)